MRRCRVDLTSPDKVKEKRTVKTNLYFSFLFKEQKGYIGVFGHIHARLLEMI
jgi:hypothetical protein